ncbi:hypothetical protein KFL_002510050 [Klebsormidium nitens]|uniref:Uncharacterized protein n=1 Tax=Klebsormidium nitens TaxID=105231 RepID=A0A1Y1ICC7_KLENI|nr:hypothetical protein KFL_002510050 [Klebsormidium nitens]|eukprot:GAQ85728.1 hypothetical protein KFL_002510050 [Klebsormidium nitens]
MAGQCNAVEGETRQDCRCLHFVATDEDEKLCLCNHTVNYHALPPARQVFSAPQREEQRTRFPVEGGGRRRSEPARAPANDEAQAELEVGESAQASPDPVLLSNYSAFLEELQGPEKTADFELAPHPQYGYMSVKCKPCDRVLGLSRSKSKNRFLSNIRSHLVSSGHLRRMEGRPVLGSEAGSDAGGSLNAES